VNGDQLIVSVVEEFDLVGDIHAALVATDCLSGLDLYFKLGGLVRINRYEV
jgi:hypothetical protein